MKKISLTFCLALLSSLFLSLIHICFMTRDPRSVERKKPGQPKASRRFQFSKR